MNSHKIITLEKFQRPEGKVVLVGGCFDILHIGHVIFLEEAKTRGEKLIVALESDEAIRSRKKREPFHSEQERARILSALSCVDSVVLLPLLKADVDYKKLVTKIHPDVIAITEGDPYRKQKQERATEIGAQLIVVTGVVQEKSTTEILKKMGSLKRW